MSWQHKEPPELPIYDYAPDMREVGGQVVFSASRREQPCSFYASFNENGVTAGTMSMVE